MTPWNFRSRRGGVRNHLRFRWADEKLRCAKLLRQCKKQLRKRSPAASERRGGDFSICHHLRTIRTPAPFSSDISKAHKRCWPSKQVWMHAALCNNLESLFRQQALDIIQWQVIDIIRISMENPRRYRRHAARDHQKAAPALRE